MQLVIWPLFLFVFTVFFHCHGSNVMYVQEVGFFMSPGDRSYDAIGLMKEVGEHTAAACANAQEVLGNETPQSLLKGRRGKYENQNKGKNHLTNSLQGVRSTLAPDILVRLISLFSLSLTHTITIIIIRLAFYFKNALPFILKFWLFLKMLKSCNITPKFL